MKPAVFRPRSCQSQLMSQRVQSAYRLKTEHINRVRPEHHSFIGTDLQSCDLKQIEKDKASLIRCSSV